MNHSKEEILSLPFDELAQIFAHGTHLDGKRCRELPTRRGWLERSPRFMHGYPRAGAKGEREAAGNVPCQGFDMLL